MNNVIQVTEHFAIKQHRAAHDDLIACRCCGRIIFDDPFFEHIHRVEEMRVELGFGLRMTCGHRCTLHNASVGGAAASVHLDFASDIQPWNADPVKLNEIFVLAEEMEFDGIGKYNSFCHLDSRSLYSRPAPARWDNRT